MKTCAAFVLISACSFAADTGLFGRVVDAQTHEPVRRAIIKIYTSKQQWDEFTDGEGRFKFPPFARAAYTLVAHRDGYSDHIYKVELSDFDDPKELPIELHKQGLITGKIVDRSGEPLEGAHIEALNIRASGAQVQAAVSAETNDLGEYRLSGIDPGTYRVRATYRAGSEHELDSTPLTMATAFFGSGEKPAEIAVKSGSVAPGIDFVLNAVRPATIRGTLRTDAGKLTERVNMWILGQAGEGGHNASGRDGVFQLPDTGPGVYTVTAQTLSKTARLFGSTSVTVHESDVDGIEIVLRPTPKLEGQVSLTEGNLADSRIKSIFFHCSTPARGFCIESAQLDLEGKFSLSLNPGEYTISFDSSFDVQKATLDDRPVTNWKIQMSGAETKKLVIVMKPKAKQ